VLIHQLPQVFAEVKRVERLNVPLAMKTAHTQASAAGKTPVLFHRRDREEWLVTIRLADMLLVSQMVEAARCMRGEAEDQPSPSDSI